MPYQKIGTFSYALESNNSEKLESGEYYSHNNKIKSTEIMNNLLIFSVALNLQQFIGYFEYILFSDES